MFRVWAKIVKENRLQKDMVIENSSAVQSRTAKVMDALEKVCNTFDLSHPIWLDNNISDFKRLAKTRFTADNFVETIPFDYLEFQIIEEDHSF